MPRKRPAAPSAVPTTNTVTATPTLATEKKALLALKDLGEEQHWQMGVHYNNIVDLKLAEKAGFLRASDFFAKEMKELPQSTLTRYGSVAKTFTQKQAVTYGVSKLEMLLAYEKAAILGPQTGDPGGVLVDVPVPKGLLTTPKKFSDCSSSDLRRALTRLRPRKANPDSQKRLAALPSRDRVRVNDIASTIKQILGNEASVQVSATQVGHETAVDLTRIPLSLFDTMMDVLSAINVPR